MSEMPRRSALLTEVLDLGHQIGAEVPSLAPELAEISDRAEQPLRVAIAGKVKAGKSTLLNALVGDELAPTDAGECTKLVTWYQHGLVYRVEMTSRDGSTSQLPFEREDGAIDVDLGDRDITQIERLTVEWPVKTLEDMTLIDTPGIASVSTDISARSHSFLAPDDEKSTPSDAVIYLLRHLHATDVSFLHSFHEDEYAQPSPINCVAVLSRADEVAVGRLDAMSSAARIARRYGDDPRLRRLVQTVIPVAGLLAQAGTGLRELEFRRLVKLAQASETETDRLMLTTDRFVNAPTDVGLDEAQRRALLHRLGLFGVRLAVHSIRTGDVASTASLASMLRVESGIDQLRGTLFDVFGARRDTLKARSALLAMQRLVAEHQTSEALDARIERTIAGAHEFTELRILNEIRSGALAISGDGLAELERLLGASGTQTNRRLGLPEDSGADKQKAAVLEELGKWRERAESPLSPRPLASAARVAVRTCEGLFATIAAG
jgi:GTPase SAR1 family protein